MTATYYKLPPQDIFLDILESTQKQKKVHIKGMDLYVHAHVYPSDKFRSTNFILENIEPVISGATVCDMGCGMGIVGLFAMRQGAKRVVQVDINPFAIKNAIANRNLYGYSEIQIEIVKSDCFEKVPKQIFDLIVFNIPFHSEPHKIKDPLEYAFYDPNFASIKKFLHQVVNYSNSKTNILIAFSNKGDVSGLEEIFQSMNFRWKLWKRINQNQQFDNRLYLLSLNA